MAAIFKAYKIKTLAGIEVFNKMKERHDKIRFGTIGCGRMGREFASTVARWCHFTDMDLQPEITAICNRSLAPGH